jgi:hypothetical protein
MNGKVASLKARSLHRRIVTTNNRYGQAEASSNSDTSTLSLPVTTRPNMVILLLMEFVS